MTGATGGIGQAIARAVAARGAEVIVSGRRVEMLEELGRELRATVLACDLADRVAVGQLVDQAGEVDVLVANAALPGTGLLADFDQDDIDRTLEVNLRAPIALAKAVVPAMRARGRGHLVFISSLNGRVATPATSIYAATKFGLRGFAHGLRQDLRPHGIGVSVVLPGFVREAGMFAEVNPRLPPGVRTVSPSEVAAGVIRAIERDRAEIAVAPLGLRAGSAVGSVAPELAAAVNRLVGSDRIATELAAGHRGKR